MAGSKAKSWIGCASGLRDGTTSRRAQRERISPADLKKLERAAAPLESRGAFLVAYSFEALFKGNAPKGGISFSRMPSIPCSTKTYGHSAQPSTRKRQPRPLGVRVPQTLRPLRFLFVRTARWVLLTASTVLPSVKENSMPNYKSHTAAKSASCRRIG